MTNIIYYRVYYWNDEGRKNAVNFLNIDNALQWIKDHPYGKDILFNRREVVFEDD